MYWIDTRGFKLALEQTKAATSLSDAFVPGQRLEVCPEQDAYLLGMEFVHPFPICRADGVFLTARDVLGPTSLELRFADFRFTVSALRAALYWISVEDKATALVKEHGQRLLASQATAVQWARFSEEVCAWGRGMRVWANLLRHHGGSAEEVGRKMKTWLSAAQTANNARYAMQEALEIKGLGVSFASKHLRMLYPRRYGVLDSVLETGLGFAMNVEGFAFFTQCLHDFLAENAEHLGPDFSSVADFEWALFALVRAKVRNSPSEEGDSSMS